MIKSTYSVIGVMSGTSLDGIDLALMTFNFNGNWSFKIHCAETVAYSKSWKHKLSQLVSYNRETLNLIDKDYTTHLSEIINNFIKNNSIKHIDAVCSHGHTALHQPEHKLTFQIGNLEQIAKLTNTIVVCDFRTQDLALNGQGAPLVPIGDRLLFPEYDSCINLGGFANISKEIDNQRIAYDICPLNIVMNKYAKKIGCDFDDSGEIAKSGQINYDLLNDLNGLTFYQEMPPKSLGLEWVKTHMFSVFERYNLSVKDILRTFVEHVAQQISDAIRSGSKVLFTGGGTYNSFLLERINSLKKFDLIVPEDVLVEFKEALIFGLLGVLKLRDENNCLASVTGADHDHCSGVIYSP